MAIRDYPEYISDKDNYIYVEDVDKCVDNLLGISPKVIAVDTETNYDENLVGAISRFINGVPNNNPFCVTLFYGDTGYYISHDLDKLKRLFENENIRFVLHNHKYDRHMLANIGINLDISRIDDTMVMIHLINEEFMCNTPDGTKVKSKKLKDLAYHFLKKDAHKLEELVAEYRMIKAMHNRAEGKEGGKDKVSYKEIEELNKDLMKDYACADVEFTYKLYYKFLPEIARQGLEKAYAIDMQASDAVFKMERRGVKIDKAYYEKLYNDYGEELENRLANLREMTGNPEFSVDSSKDIVEAFGKMEVIWAWFTLKKEPKTDKQVLEHLAEFKDHANIVNLATAILEYRDIQKVRDTFIKNMMDYCQWDGRVHPDFNVCPNDFNSGSTRTGRLSSSNPNFQNLPKDDKRIRYGIIPEEGYLLVEIDAAQQEYRMLGHYAQDKNFMKLIHDGVDIHTGTAMLMFNLPEEEASKREHRQVGKKLNFGLVYSLGLAALAKALGCKLDESLYNKATATLMQDKVPYKRMFDMEYLKEAYKDNPAIQYYCGEEAQAAITHAKEMKEKYFSQFPDIQAFLNTVKQVAKDYGYVRTWGGRKRHFANPSKEAYKAPNALIQGSCGDILKVKLAELEEFLANKKTRVINTVHDSILFEVDKEEFKEGIVDELVDLLRNLPFRVPMDWEAEGSTVSWADIKDVNDIDLNEE